MTFRCGKAQSNIESNTSELMQFVFSSVNCRRYCKPQNKNLKYVDTYCLDCAE